MANIHINVSLPTTFDTFCKSGTVICVFLLTRQYWKLWTLCLDYLWKWTRIYLFWTIVGIAHTLWCTLVQLLHYILKCIHLEWRWLFGPFRYMLIQTVWLIVQIISIPDEELFSETAVGCTVSYFVQNYMMFLLVLTPPPYFEADYCLFCGRRRVAVARYRMICLVLDNIFYLHSKIRLVPFRTFSSISLLL